MIDEWGRHSTVPSWPDTMWMIDEWGRYSTVPSWPAHLHLHGRFRASRLRLRYEIWTPLVLRFQFTILRHIHLASSVRVTEHVLMPTFSPIFTYIHYYNTFHSGWVKFSKLSLFMHQQNKLSNRVWRRGEKIHASHQNKLPNRVWMRGEKNHPSIFHA
jgi:hypothetical protein